MKILFFGPAFLAKCMYLFRVKFWSNFEIVLLYVLKKISTKMRVLTDFACTIFGFLYYFIFIFSTYAFSLYIFLKIKNMKIGFPKIAGDPFSFPYPHRYDMRKSQERHFRPPKQLGCGDKKCQKSIFSIFFHIFSIFFPYF